MNTPAQQAVPSLHQPQTVAQTGNPQIPASPQIAQQQVQSGAVAPQTVQQPTPTPVVPETPATSEPSPTEKDFWGDVMFDTVTQEEPTAVVPPAEPPVGQPQPQPQPVVEGQPPVQQPEPAPVLETPAPTGLEGLSPEQVEAITAATPQPQAPVQPQQPAPQPQATTPAQQMVTQLEQTLYQIPKDDADRLVTEPEAVLPSLAARMHVTIAAQLGQAVQQALPAVVERVVEQRMKSQNTENDFFRSYPQLADPRFRTVVVQSLQAAKHVAGAQATRQQVMQDGAALAAMKLRVALQPQAAVQQPQVASVPQGQQPAPVQQTNGQMQVIQPFQPAIGPASTTPTAPQDPPNIFAELADDMDW